ncbi:MAG TPA: Gfo/Idh/MocA family oxidoreductase [Pirellulales bacterium]|jgi:predicted dehydrogenase|nr:Gfo/Idh/MocA family oxidoreductase [Pirellulales bacterium]
MSRIGVAVVGLGFGRQVHVPAFRADPRAKVVALVARDAARAREAANELGIPKALDDWRAAIDDADVQVMSIAAPQPVQAEIALAALGAGKAVFCEKPLSGDIRQAQRLVDAAARTGLPNLVNFEFTAHPAWLAARERLERGAIGDLTYLDVTWHVLTYGNRARLRDWRSDPATGGGALNAFATHVFHYLEWFGGPIARLCARTGTIAGDDRPGEVLVNLWADFASGARAAVSLNTAAGPGNVHRLRLYGTAGALELVNTQRDYLAGFQLLEAQRTDDTWCPVPVDASSPAGEDGRIRPTARLASRLLDWLCGAGPQQPSFADACRVEHLVDFARRSSARGAWIEVDDQAQAAAG